MQSRKTKIPTQDKQSNACPSWELCPLLPNLTPNRHSPSLSDTAREAQTICLDASLSFKSAGATAPYSVIMAVIKFAGVTSKAGL
jgi:hypothetical protein